MHRSLTPMFACPTCKKCDANLALHEFSDGQDGHVRDGALVCQSCRAWFPIDNELLELVPAELQDPATIQSLFGRFGQQMKTIGLMAPANVKLGAEYSEQVKQREHFDLYAESLIPGFADYTQSHFIKAASRRFYNIWGQKLEQTDKWILDIGCGTANSCFPFVDGHNMVGFDISKKVIRRDINESIKLGHRAKTTFFVGDGNFLAFKDNSFHCAQTFGSLHHMPAPAQTIREIHRVLVPNGKYFAVENNQSVFRGIFDLMMKIYPLWVEEAGAEPLISRKMVDDWCDGLPVRVSSETSIFLPPHLFNLFSQRTADLLVEFSDRILSRIPFFGKQGGQLIFLVEKNANTIEPAGTSRRSA